MNSRIYVRWVNVRKVGEVDGYAVYLFSLKINPTKSLSRDKVKAFKQFMIRECRKNLTVDSIIWYDGMFLKFVGMSSTLIDVKSYFPKQITIQK